jgi:hypothetical protein
MTHRLAFLGLLSLLGVFAGAAVVSAAETATPAPADTNKLAALVQRLGDDSFEAREAAYGQLEQLGKAAQPALEEAAKSTDPEVKSRAKRLLDHLNRTEVEVALDVYLANKDASLILKLPSWERYKKIIGEDETSRNLFVEMYTMEGNLLTALDGDQKKFEDLFAARIQQIQQTLYGRWGQPDAIPMSQVVALLFVATDARAKVNINSFYLMTSLFHPENIQKGFKTNAGARKLLVEFFETRTDQNTMPQAIQLAMQMELKEMAPAALKLATNKNAAAWTRATAVVAVGKLGTKDNMKDLEELLKDTTNLGNMQFNPGNGQVLRVTTEMRDAALAAMILLSGQDVQDYDFPYLKAVHVDKRYLAYSYFGFSDDTQRQAALKKFKESQEKKDDKKEEKKEEKK